MDTLETKDMADHEGGCLASETVETGTNEELSVMRQQPFLKVSPVPKGLHGSQEPSTINQPSTAEEPSDMNDLPVTSMSLWNNEHPVTRVLSVTTETLVFNKHAATKESSVPNDNVAIKELSVPKEPPVPKGHAVTKELSVPNDHAVTKESSVPKAPPVLYDHAVAIALSVPNNMPISKPATNESSTESLSVSQRQLIVKELTESLRPAISDEMLPVSHAAAFSRERVRLSHQLINEKVTGVTMSDQLFSCQLCPDMRVPMELDVYMQHLTQMQHMKNVFAWLRTADAASVHKYESLAGRIKASRKDEGLFCEFCRKASFNVTDIKSHQGHLSSDRHVNVVKSLKSSHSRLVESFRKKADTGMQKLASPHHDKRNLRLMRFLGKEDAMLSSSSGRATEDFSEEKGGEVNRSNDKPMLIERQTTSTHQGIVRSPSWSPIRNLSPVADTSDEVEVVSVFGPSSNYADRQPVKTSSIRHGSTEHGPTATSKSQIRDSYSAQRPSSPSLESRSPQSRSPRLRSRSPGSRSYSSHSQSNSHHQKSYSSYPLSHSSHPRPRSPRGPVRSPHTPTRSSHQRSFSPLTLSRSPVLQSNSSGPQSQSSDLRSCSSNQRPRSPGLQSQSLHLQSRSPRLRSRSPRLRSRSPRLRSRSPRLRSRSPKRRHRSSSRDRNRRYQSPSSGCSSRSKRKHSWSPDHTLLTSRDKRSGYERAPRSPIRRRAYRSSRSKSPDISRWNRSRSRDRPVKSRSQERFSKRHRPSPPSGRRVVMEKKRLRPRPLSPWSINSLTFLVEKKWTDYYEKYYSSGTKSDAQCLAVQHEYLRAYKGFFMEDPNFDLCYSELLKPETLRALLTERIDHGSPGPVHRDILHSSLPRRGNHTESSQQVNDERKRENKWNRRLEEKSTIQSKTQRAGSPDRGRYSHSGSEGFSDSRVQHREAADAFTTSLSPTPSPVQEAASLQSFDKLKSLIREKLKIPSRESSKPRTSITSSIQVPDLVKQALHQINSNKAREEPEVQRAATYSSENLRFRNPFLGFVHNVLSGILKMTGLQDDVDTGNAPAGARSQLYIEQRRMHESMVTPEGHLLIRMARMTLANVQRLDSKFGASHVDVVSILKNLDRDVLQLIADTPMLKQ